MQQRARCKIKCLACWLLLENVMNMIDCSEVVIRICAESCYQQSTCIDLIFKQNYIRTRREFSADRYDINLIKDFVRFCLSDTFSSVYFYMYRYGN